MLDTPKESMTKELQAEYDYRLQERLGMLCGDMVPTKEQIALAEREARKAVEDLQDEEAIDF